MGVVIDVAVTLLTASIMSILPGFIKLLTNHINKEQRSTIIEIKSPSGLTQTIEVTNDMSAEQAQQVSQQLTKMIKSETSTT